MSTAADDERSALARLNLGLRLRLVELVVVLPLLALAFAYQHPVAVWFQRASWILGPVSGFLLISGANGCGARPAGLAFGMATAAEAYAAFMGFYGSPVALEQVPFASSTAEILGLIGLVSMVSSLRGSAEDASAPNLLRLCYRASANIWVTLACVILVRLVTWQVGLDGLPSTIVTGVVIAFAAVALMSVLTASEGVRALGDKPPAAPEEEAAAEGHRPQ